MTTIYMVLDSYNPEILGQLPDIFRESDPRTAIEQVNDRYPGGWNTVNGFEERDGKLYYPGDPPLRPLAAWVLHNEEMIVLYEHDFVAVCQYNGQFEVARLTMAAPQ